MNASRLYVLFLIFCPVLAKSWKYDGEGHSNIREPHKDSHYLTKRHMRSKEAEPKKRLTTPRQRNKPSGHLSPLQEEEIEDDAGAAVAIDPPPNKLKQEKVPRKKHTKPIDTLPPPIENQPPPKPIENQNQNQNPHTSSSPATAATELVKNVLTELGKEFVTHQVNEDFVFGQYVGHAMRNLTTEFRIKMQHEILELVVKYQKLSRGDILDEKDPKNIGNVLKKVEKKGVNDTDEGWTDFSNLANIVV